jgi:hypothetical protein
MFVSFVYFVVKFFLSRAAENWKGQPRNTRKKKIRKVNEVRKMSNGGTLKMRMPPSDVMM